MEKIRSEHLTETEIEDIVRGSLLRGHAPEVFSHYFNCDHCAELVDGEQNLKAELRKAVEADAAPSAPAAGERLWSRIVAFPAPAVAAIALGALLVSLPIAKPFRATDQTVELSAYRGNSLEASAATGPLLLRLDATGAAAGSKVALAIVNAGGQQVWTSNPRLENDVWIDRVSSRLEKGLYWVRLTDTTTQSLLREYRLDIR